MKETFAEIASLIAQGGPTGLARWWKAAQRGINRLLKMILVWPIAMFACAMWSSSIAQKVVPILALMPVAFFLYFMLKFVNPATVGMLAIPRARELVQKVARQVGILIAAECGLGLFLWFVPISNDRWLAPVLLLSVLAFFGLKLADIGGGMRAVLALLIVGIAVVFMIGGRAKLESFGKSITANSGVSLPQVNYNSSKICEDAFNDDFDNSLKNLRYFDVELHEGCFGGFVHLPKSWSNWYAQPHGDQTGFWIAYWHENRRTPLGPYGPNANYHFDYMTTVFRLQGRGAVRFYSNVAVPTTRYEPSADPPAELATNTGGATVSTRVEGSREWTDTGINLRIGDTVTTSATGSIKVTRDGHIPFVPEMSPEGYPPDCTAAMAHDLLNSNRHPFPASQLPCWSLVGRVGAQGSIFEIGAERNFQVALPGELYLGVNDEYVDDNSGYWTAAITVRHAASPAALSSEPTGAISEASPPAEPDDKSERAVEAPISGKMDEIMFVVNSCRFKEEPDRRGRAHNSIICSLQFTNEGGDRDMRLGGQFGGTRIIDQSGREYVVQVLRLGVRECTGCAVVNRLATNVPMSVGLSFANVASDISLISLLEINYSMDGGGRWSTVQFRGIPVAVGSGRRQ